MNILDAAIADITKKPTYGSKQYEEWVKQDDFLEFLQKTPHFEEIPLYLSNAYSFLFGVFVPSYLVNPPDATDINRWNFMHTSSWGIFATESTVSISPPLDGTGSSTLDQGEQIIFVRKFDGRREQKSYIEILPRLTHAFQTASCPRT